VVLALAALEGTMRNYFIGWLGILAFATVVILATYFTFELIPTLYGKRWVPVLVMGAYAGALWSGISYIWKWFDLKTPNWL
jgi:hypothetical protein